MYTVTSQTHKAVAATLLEVIKNEGTGTLLDICANGHILRKNILHRLQLEAAFGSVDRAKKISETNSPECGRIETFCTTVTDPTTDTDRGVVVRYLHGDHHFDQKNKPNVIEARRRAIRYFINLHDTQIIQWCTWKVSLNVDCMVRSTIENHWDELLEFLGELSLSDIIFHQATVAIACAADDDELKKAWKDYFEVANHFNYNTLPETIKKSDVEVIEEELLAKFEEGVCPDAFEDRDAAAAELM